MAYGAQGRDIRSSVAAVRTLFSKHFMCWHCCLLRGLALQPEKIVEVHVAPLSLLLVCARWLICYHKSPRRQLHHAIFALC